MFEPFLTSLKMDNDLMFFVGMECHESFRIVLSKDSIKNMYKMDREEQMGNDFLEIKFRFLRRDVMLFFVGLDDSLMNGRV